MNKRLTDLGTPRRMFLAVIVVLALVLAWKLSEPQRTGIREHRLGNASRLDDIIGRPTYIYFGTNYLWWYYKKEGNGTFLLATYSAAQWDVAAYTGNDLSAVKPQDARVDFFGTGASGSRVFGFGWGTNELMVQDGQIVLLRHGSDRQTVYAVQVVAQSDGVGHFRSRKILPAPR